MTKHEKFIWIFLIAVFFTFTGYLWRIYHENNTHYELFESGKRAMIREISHEIQWDPMFNPKPDAPRPEEVRTEHTTCMPEIGRPIGR